MLGLGEKKKEIRQALQDLAQIGLDVLTLGQYLQPSSEYTPIDRWVTPDEFARWKDEALEMGIKVVESGPLVRSSYHAEEQSEKFANEKATPHRSSDYFAYISLFLFSKPPFRS